MDEPTTESELFLQAVGQSLPFGDRERLEILEELRQHLDDCFTASVDGGMDPAEAERAAVGRLGPPEWLAEELTRARREPRRLLAAAGAGVWGAVRGGIWGGLVGFCIVMVAAVAWNPAMNAAVRYLGVQWGQGGWDPASNSVLGLVVFACAAFAAGRVTTPAVAARAAFGARLVRRVTVPLGAAILLWYVTLIWSGALSWPAVVVLMSVPLWWIAGAWHTGSPWLRVPRRLAGGLLLVLAVSIVASLLLGPWPSGSPILTPSLRVQSFDRIGVPVPAEFAKWGSGELTSGGYVGLGLDVADRGLVAGWGDFRVEAWKGTGAAYYGGPDPNETAPFLTGPVEWSAAGTSPDGSLTWSSSSPWPANAATLSGGLALNHWPGVSFAWVVITGIAPDGRRHLLTQPSGFQVVFSGTALDWFEAILAGR
jgi:hypothetical protein